MSSRRFHRTLVFTLAISVGAFTLPHTGAAASGRSGSQPAGGSLQGDLFSFSGSLFEAVKNLLGMLKDEHSGRPPGSPNGHDPDGPSNREGTGICPHGHM
jgi:hypothetical protein